jgi:hypothetical protein
MHIVKTASNDVMYIPIFTNVLQLFKKPIKNIVTRKIIGVLSAYLSTLSKE